MEVHILMDRENNSNYRGFGIIGVWLSKTPIIGKRTSDYPTGMDGFNQHSLARKKTSSIYRALGEVLIYTIFGQIVKCAKLFPFPM